MELIRLTGLLFMDASVDRLIDTVIFCLVIARPLGLDSDLGHLHLSLFDDEGKIPANICCWLGTGPMRASTGPVSSQHRMFAHAFSFFEVTVGDCPH